MKSRSVPLLRLVFVLVAALLAVGCADAQQDEATAPSDSKKSAQPAVAKQDVPMGRAFSLKVLRRCKVVRDQVRKVGPLPVPNYNPRIPDEAQLPRVAAHMSKLGPVYKDLSADLRALGAPPMGQELWGGYIGQLDDFMRTHAELMKVAKQQNALLVIATTVDLENRARNLRGAAEDMGVKVCSEL